MDSLPRHSSSTPTDIAAQYVHVRFQIPKPKQAKRHSPNATAKKMLEPRFGTYPRTVAPTGQSGVTSVQSSKLAGARVL